MHANITNITKKREAASRANPHVDFPPRRGVFSAATWGIFRRDVGCVLITLTIFPLCRFFDTCYLCSFVFRYGLLALRLSFLCLIF